MAEPASIVVSEAESAALVSRELAFAAVRDAFLSLSDSSGQLNPVVMAPGIAEGDTFSLKSGSAAAAGLLGFKCGAYFTGADSLDLPRHSSNTLLLDPVSGRLQAIVGASEVNCYRTAAANAVAAKVLARQDATVLTVVGAGHQAWYEVDALAGQFALEQVNIVSRSASPAEALAARLDEELQGIAVKLLPAEEAIPAADLLVTVTTAREPLFPAELVQAGTHVSAMGADQAGKQELPVELLHQSSLFADLPAQSLRVGEFQHISDEVSQGRMEINLLGDVLAGKAAGRSKEEQITVFDSSGVALQDLFVARRILDAYLAQGGIVTGVD